MGGIKDMSSPPPCQNIGGIYQPHPPQDLRPWLGPLLFLVLLSDISSDINHSSVVSFADDTRVYRQINEISDCSLLQYDLDNIYTWASVNNMVFNDSKFQHMSYHHQLQHRSCNHIYLSPSMNIIKSNDYTLAY